MKNNKIYKKESFGNEKSLKAIVEFMNNNPDRSKKIARKLQRICKKIAKLKANNIMSIPEVIEIMKQKELDTIQNSYYSYPNYLITHINCFIVTKYNKLLNNKM